MFTTYRVPPRSPEEKKHEAHPLDGLFDSLRGRLQGALGQVATNKPGSKKGSSGKAQNSCRSRLARAH